ncbi:acyltransferase [Frankia sp. CNm7]|uniref:Acyltransferase n=2 Tax=Frankia nepalensis TaxID=1836974 RepID=A0A937RNY3_9ACTN|nr:acyltransferase [Frankia nepalensis]MBL7514514.1 acyltransferase [Frankia nepalensis]MBL7522917.1 acyltransferase [Frankia nepalensis]MBL7633517.1 acyltransferase [Frankia nepalensis]
MLLDRGAAAPATTPIGPGDTDTTGTFLAPIVHSPGLDGLRALAVLAVIAYHAGLPFAPGGLLGVDTFMVLSGFLITGLLVAEYRATRRIDLKDFWLRRLRRLLPALLLLLLAVSAYARFIAPPGDATKIRFDTLAALFYVANWRFALSEQSYFDHFSAPSPLLHTWSLAVEEQFYVLWPLLVFLLMRHSARTVDRWKGQRQKAQSAALTVAVLGAEASALIGIGLLLTGVDASRIYYGTEVRIQALLIGAALAVWRAQRKAGFTPRGKKVLGHAGLAAAAAMLALWATVDGESRGLYAGGFFGVALIVAVLVAAIVEVPNSAISKILSISPLTYIGKISYGLYLWHWPVLLTLTAGRTGLHGPALLGARIGATVACTLLSFYLVENPIRRRKLRIPKPVVTTPAIIAGVVAVAFLATGTQASTARTPADLEKLAREVQANGVPQSVGPDAAGNPPSRMLIAGDSLATTLVGSQFADVAASMNMQLADASMLGCGVARLPTRKLDGEAGPTTIGCEQWPERFAKRVDEVKPDVAGLLVGRWEVTDQLLDGRWVHVGDPSFDAYLATQLDLAIKTLSAQGAKVVLFTTPAVAAREGPDGTRYPETKPERVASFNELLRAAASRHPGVATISDLNAVLTPGNRFTDHVNGILTRDDGVHITAAGGRLVGQALLPAIVELVRPTRTDRAPVVTPTSPG